jgi:hypothetical protein
MTVLLVRVMKNRLVCPQGRQNRAGILINQVVIDELKKYKQKQERLCQENGTALPEQVFTYCSSAFYLKNYLM